MLNVLLIEDDNLMHEVIDSYLTQYGKQHAIEINFKALHDPVQGLLEATVFGNQYNLILLDVRLPRLSGDQIYTTLLNKDPGLAEHVLFVTGYGKELKQQLTAKKPRILDKPFQYTHFESAVSVMLA